MFNPLQSARDLTRLYEIGSVLARYGFGGIVKALGLSRALSRFRRRRRGEARELTELELPERVRRVLEELGPTFIKLGQVLATRLDLLGREWIEELQRLQRHSPPVEYRHLRAQLTADLGAPPEEVFAAIDEQPYAAASIAQTHRARTKAGEEVILKIRRPGIERTIDSDLRLLEHLAELAEARLPELRRYRPSALVRQFAASLRRELDFTIEARSMQRIAAALDDDSIIVVPRIYRRWSGERLLVEEFIDGIPGHDAAALRAAGLDGELIARSAAREIFRMILVDGFFHADPHGGNLIYLRGNRLALVDFGMVGRLSRSRRGELIDLLAALLGHDAEGAAELLLRWSDAATADLAPPLAAAPDRGRLADAIELLAESTFGAELRQLNVARFFGDVTRIMREQHLTLLPDFALMVKTLATLEGLGLQLAPSFDFASEIEPVIREALSRRYAPGTLAARGWRAANDLAGLLPDLPGDLRTLRRLLRRGQLHHLVRMEQLEQFSERLDRVASRLAISFVTAAFIVGAAVVVAAETGPVVLGLRLFEVLGIGAVLGGLWVLVSIWRGRSRH